MRVSVYQLMKGVNEPVRFKGLEAQYIWWFAAGLLGCFLVFTFLYLAGSTVYACTITSGLCTVFWIRLVYHLNKKFGSYGLMKQAAYKALPEAIVTKGRTVFFKLHTTQ